MGKARVQQPGRPHLAPPPATCPTICCTAPPLQYMYQNGWDDLIYNASVDLTITGHFHVYSRTCPVHQRTCIPGTRPDGRLGGPIHVTTGWGGPQSFGNLAAPPWPYIAATNNASSPNGFLRVAVSRTQLAVEALAVGCSRRRRCMCEACQPGCGVGLVPVPKASCQHATTVAPLCLIRKCPSSTADQLCR